MIRRVYDSGFRGPCALLLQHRRSASAVVAARTRMLMFALGLVLPLVSVIPSGRAVAQTSPDLYDYARPSLKWFTIETEHFDVIFHHDSAGQGSSRTAQAVARIAEEVYEPITSLYEHRPEKVSIILKDFEDYSNGAAYFFDNKIEIWAPALDSPLRGDHNWLRNVITHEFTHMVQVQATMKANRQLPFFYLQVLDYEDVRRPDVLYGYPDVIVTYPVPVLNNPAWLAEGTAQYQRAFLRYDHWDTHRDMLLRTRVLAGEELTLDEMGGFYSHSSLLREGVYNHGFAFTQYLASTYGEDVLRRIARALSKWSNWNVQRALRDATGVSGNQVYEDWMRTLRREYEARTADIRDRLVGGTLIEEDGFSNFHPTYSPDGGRIAYVSNRGEHFNLMSLYVVDAETGGETAYELDGLGGAAAGYTCSLGYEHKVRSGVGGAVSWHPDGQRIAYARTKDTPEGYRFSDLYVLELETEEIERLTHDARAFDPAFSPDGSELAFVGNDDGTTNLFVLDVETRDVRAITRYDDGTQVSDPAWHPGGEWIYFARSAAGGRDLFRANATGDGAPEAVIATEADERSPAFDRSGDALYYASDGSGIFNLYRSVIATPGTGSAASERITNVIGGAFQPDVGPDGSVLFSRYDWNGYKIARLERPAALESPPAYEPPPITQKGDAPALAAEEWGHLNTFDDTDLRPMPGSVVTDIGTSERFAFEGGGSGVDDEPASDSLAVKRYGTSFTDFSFYPVLRFDNYSSRRQSSSQRRLPPRTYAETLARNTKVGVYVSSREILEEMTLLGGLLVGPASRPAESAGDYFSPSHLLDLERDAFLLVDYRRGFGILPKRWSPQISLEFYNIKRNVENGLSVEEFPCTACFPDTTLVDLAYGLWEADIYARSKFNPYLLAEIGYRYSPYRVTTERFFSKEADQFVPETTSRYFIGRAFTAGLYLEVDHPHKHSNVLPERLKAELRYEHEVGRLLDRFDVEDGVLVPTYEENGNDRLTLDLDVGIRLPGLPAHAAHGLGLRFRGSTILGAAVDDFYNDYVGGFIGARGYPFYALGGNETLWLQAAYHFPIFPDISRQILFTYIDKLYGRIYADAAMAWSGPWPGLGEARRDVGAELRLGLGSFYLLPTAVFLSATYGLDAFDFSLDEGFVTPDGSRTVRYGNELLWHFGILFNFDL